MDRVDGTIEKKKLLFNGFREGAMGDESEISTLLNIIFLYTIWQSRLSRKIPYFTTIEEHMLTIFDNCIRVSTRLTGIVETNASIVCRTWRFRHGCG